MMIILLVDYELCDNPQRSEAVFCGIFDNPGSLAAAKEAIKQTERWKTHRAAWCEIEAGINDKVQLPIRWRAE